MTDSTARQLGYGLLVGSELELLAATNNQESDAHVRRQNTYPGRLLVNAPVRVFAAVALISLPTVMFGGLLLHTGLSRTGQWIVGALLVAGSWRNPAACSFTWASASQDNGRPETR
jgi:hypothetical protein